MKKDGYGKIRRWYYITKFYSPDNNGIFQAVKTMCDCGFRRDNAVEIYNALTGIKLINSIMGGYNETK
jgi:hypothetical protein